MSQWDREALKAAVQLNGGVRAVASGADVPPASLSRWLNGQPTLSPASLERVFAAIGLTGGYADPDIVHHWHPRKLFPEIGRALQLYFPTGTEVARAEWSELGLARLRKLMRLSLAPEVYALTDGKTRGVLRLPAGPMLGVDQIDGLRWVNGGGKGAILTIDDIEMWTRGEVEPVDFQTAWPLALLEPSDDDVLAAIGRAGISNAEAILRIRRPRK